MAVTCSFCKAKIEQGTGKIYAMKDGKILNFCSMKCEKNTLKLKRIPRKITWVTKQKK